MRFEKKGQQDKKLLPLVTKWRVYTKAFMASGLSGQYGRMFTFNCEIYINKDLNYEQLIKDAFDDDLSACMPKLKANFLINEKGEDLVARVWGKA